MLATVTASSGSLVDIDQTLFIQLGVFLVMFLLLRTLLFKPVLGLIEARRRATDGRRVEAHALEEEAKQLSDEVERKLRKARKEAKAERKKLLDEARASERDIISNARSSAHALMEEAQKKAESEALQVAAELKGQTKTLAESVAHKALGRPVQ